MRPNVEYCYMQVQKALKTSSTEEDREAAEHHLGTLYSEIKRLKGVIDALAATATNESITSPLVGDSKWTLTPRR